MCCKTDKIKMLNEDWSFLSKIMDEIWVDEKMQTGIHSWEIKFHILYKQNEKEHTHVS